MPAAPLNRTLPVPQLNAPELSQLPETVKVLVPPFKTPLAAITRLLHTAPLETVGSLAVVAASGMVTLSVLEGATPESQFAPAAQSVEAEPSHVTVGQFVSTLYAGATALLKFIQPKFSLQAYPLNSPVAASLVNCE